MGVSEEFAVDMFCRTYTDMFTLKDFIKCLTIAGVKLTKEEALRYLAESPYVFSMNSGERYITRAGAFTNKFFSFTLTQDEIRNRMFVAGHRMMPFADPMQRTSSFCYFWDGSQLSQKTGVFRKELALDLFWLYGEEYEVQYIAQDPANSDLDIAACEYELPKQVKLTGCDIGQFIDEGSLSAGDRILCRVIDWDRGYIEIFPQPKLKFSKNEPIRIDRFSQEKNHWHERLEQIILDAFERFGPCASIEEQLAYVFLIGIDELCDFTCDSFENCLKRTSKFDIQLFGVETRLWFKGQDVPAIGVWNNLESEETRRNPMEKVPFSVPEYVLESFLYDFMFRKEKDISVLLKSIFPQSFGMTPEEREAILLHIKTEHAIIEKNYNLYADFPVGEIRHRALALYSRITSLVYEIECTSSNWKKYPQQELVILSQLNAHINRILETMLEDPDGAVSEKATLLLSLEGMEYNFEDIEGALRKALFNEKRNDFTVI